MTKTQNRKPTIHEEVTATLERLEAEDPGLKQFLKKAHGYAVFPSVGKAALVLGGAYGRGEVFERGRLIGYATIAQTTIGVQIGGDTFSEVIAFESKSALDRFKKGKIAFAANASAVLVKAGAGGTADYEKGVSAFAYAEGGMLLEAAIGGQRFKFKPLGEEKQQAAKGTAKGGSGSAGRGGGQEEGDEQGGSEDSGVAGRAAGGLRDAVAKVGGLVKEHPVASTVIGAAAVGGIALLLTRAARGSSILPSFGSSDSDEDEGEESEPRDEMDRGSEESDESDEEEEGRDDAGEENDEAGEDYDEEDQGDREDEEDEERDDEGEDEAEEQAPRRSRSRSRS